MSVEREANVEHDLRGHLDALRMLHDISRELNAARDLTRTLQMVADSVVSSLGFSVAVVNVVREDALEVAAVAGSADVREALQGQTGTREAWDDLLAAAEHWGALRFLAHGSGALPDDLPTWLPDEQPSPEPDAWHPEDALVAPLYSPAGDLVGVLSVDQPVDGRIPGPLQLELLEMFASQAAIAVDNARLHNEVLRTMNQLELEQAALRASEDSFRQAFENAPSGMAMTGLHDDDHGRMLRINSAMCVMLGRPPDELRSLGLAAVTHPDDRHMLPSGSRTYSGDIRLLDAGGQAVWVTMHSSVVLDAAGKPDFQLVHVADVSERHLREERLAHLAAHDPLTGLTNRAELRRALDRLGADGAGVVVLYCDLDNFKKVNDTYGHDVGDLVLVEVARRLRSQVRKHDTVARVGGDEFVLVLRDISSEDAAALAARMAEHVRRPLRFGEHEISLSVSVGQAEALAAWKVDELLHTADQAMYRVKKSTREPAG